MYLPEEFWTPHWVCSFSLACVLRHSYMVVIVDTGTGLVLSSLVWVLLVFNDVVDFCFPPFGDLPGVEANWLLPLFEATQSPGMDYV